MKDKRTLRVAFQGERGAYSEAAAVEFFDGEAVEPAPCETFDEVFGCVETGECDRGIVPIENSLAGSIHRNYDLLLEHDLSIVGEQYLRIVHCLIVHPGTKLTDIRRVYSHPQALAQCESTLDWLPDAERISTYDTAGSVALIKAEGFKDAAAIASRRAAQVHEMEILKEGIADNPENYTRFLILGCETIEPALPAKTSIVFATKNVPGVLFKALSVFALRDIDLTKIESRPLKGKLWEYLFYLDFAGSTAEERCHNAIKHLEEIATYLRILGSYPRGEM
ncbi:MAG: prephenate dehydratase [Anaerolineae bacterium]